MRTTGIVRKVDELGRIVLPKDLRRTHNIETNTEMEILTDEDGVIVLKKYRPGMSYCSECGEHTDVSKLHGNANICKHCITKLAKSV